jgi:uncharacterized protein (TIGR03067 family)
MWRAAVAVACLLTAVQGDDAAKKDQELMEGTWKVVELTEQGTKIADKDLEPIEVSILANKMAIHDGGKFREEIAFKLDAGKKPRAVDFTYTKGLHTGKVELGVYTVEGDILKFCVNETKDGAKEGPRPAEFASTKENGCYLVVLKRVKKP